MANFKRQMGKGGNRKWMRVVEGGCSWMKVKKIGNNRLNSDFKNQEAKRDVGTGHNVGSIKFKMERCGGE
ncbi:hypothetical protein [Pedosphaera parvula]|uniref:Uncharacterized protein n=1 Tax=Pedosphaera parvula (strain Ellin514) TaxID=320771 RepID=B9XRW8_PEDPL|nr:hypothetical protein [Pedosphaera parvula]EEF57427.1 hypothetical protein Cflav_PD0272 [Pedosphaera parvula Ellin514]